MKKGKKVLVTGACGFVGGHLIDLLLKKGYKVRGTDLQNAPRKHVKETGIEFMPADLTKPETLPPVVKDVDIIFNLASAFNYYTPWEVMEKINVQGVKNLCNAVVKHNPDVEIFVHCSTGEVYGYNMFGKTTELSPNGELLEECSKTPGEAPYAKTKWLQEQEVWKYYKEKKLPVTAIRLGTVYGKGLFFARLINLFADIAVLGIFPKNLNFRWPLVYVKDVASAALFLAERKEKAVGKAFNVADDQNYIFSDMIYAIADYLHMELKDLPIPPMSVVWKAVPKGEIVPEIVRAAYLTLTEEIKEKGDRVWFDYNHAVPYIELILGVKEWADNFKYSNRGLKEMGWKPQCPSFMDALPEMMEWSKKEGILVKKPGLKHLATKALLF